MVVRTMLDVLFGSVGSPSVCSVDSVSEVICSISSELEVVSWWVWGVGADTVYLSCRKDISFWSAEMVHCCIITHINKPHIT